MAAIIAPEVRIAFEQKTHLKLSTDSVVANGQVASFLATTDGAPYVSVQHGFDSALASSSQNPVVDATPEATSETASGSNPYTSFTSLIQTDGTVTKAEDSFSQQTQDKTASAVVQPGPFDPHPESDLYRPYTGMVSEYDSTIATIVITNPRKPDQPVAIDFFNSFVSVAKPVAQTADNSGVVTLQQNFYGIFKNFSLMDVNESTSEAVKVTLNFGMGWTAYFFGAQPRIYSFSGMFLDTVEYPYYEQFMTAYKRYLSGSNIARAGYKFYIAYDGKLVSGYMLGINTGSSSSAPKTKNFTFQVLVDDDHFFRSGNNLDNSVQIGL